MITLFAPDIRFFGINPDKSKSTIKSNSWGKGEINTTFYNSSGSVIAYAYSVIEFKFASQTGSINTIYYVNKDMILGASTTSGEIPWGCGDANLVTKYFYSEEFAPCSVICKMHYDANGKGKMASYLNYHGDFILTSNSIFEYKEWNSFEKGTIDTDYVYSLR